MSTVNFYPASGPTAPREFPTEPSPQPAGAVSAAEVWRALAEVLGLDPSVLKWKRFVFEADTGIVGTAVAQSFDEHGAYNDGEPWLVVDYAWETY